MIRAETLRDRPGVVELVVALVLLEGDGERLDGVGHDLGPEDETARALSVVEWLSPEAVPGNEQLAFAAVPDREREHALEPFHTTDAFFLVEVEDRLRVGPRPVHMPFGFELLAQHAMVV